MKTFILFYTIFFLNSAYSNIWIVKSSQISSLYQLVNYGCSYTLLNPHLGADIYEAQCPASASLINAEKSKIWKIFSNYSVPNDPRITDQWALEIMNVSAFWKKYTTGDNKILVAVVDTGVNYLHPDLQNNLAINTKEIPNNGIDDDGNGFIDDYYGWDGAKNIGDPMDKIDHGTHVAGIIGASTDNGIGVAGINWNVGIIPVKFIDDQGGGSTESAIRSIDYAVARGVKIINASWGGSDESPLLQEIINRCQSKGILFVAAAGNETADNDKVPLYPANFPLDNIISVASIDLHKDLSWFSNWGEKTVDVAAPGESIISTVGGIGYGYKDGTSMATPQITGAAALLWSAHPDWNYLDIKKYILGHCKVDKEHIIPVLCKGYFSF